MRSANTRWLGLLVAALATSAAAAEPEAGLAAPSPSETPHSRFSLRAGTSLAVARGAGAVSVGAGFDVTPRFNLGVALEYSPWFDYLAGKAAPGTANAYLTASLGWFSAGRFEVRSGVMAGASVLLFDTPGAPAGSVGVMVGLSALQLGVKLSDRVAFELSPDAVLTVPSLRGVPLVYSQFRLSAGIRFGL